MYRPDHRPEKTSLNKPLAAVIVLLLLVFAGGCAGHNIQQNYADDVYARFLAAYSGCNATGLKATGSLFYSAEGRGHRTTITLWGNAETPLRLDVRAGIGAYIAHIREDESGLTAYYPEQETVYTHSSPQRGVKLLGLPFPFSLKDLAGLVGGCYQSLIQSTYNSVNPVDGNGDRQFFFNDGPLSSVTLTGQGIPIGMTGCGETPWRMELTSYEEGDSGKMLPGKITVYTENGGRAVLRIKTREFSASKWPDKSLEMQLPEGTRTVRLDRASYIKVN
ncbi:hypothetical protein [Maridesulfovibrio sp.]|uniref:hypothetical protein n=1 Tax=Maridesulfovibrio sp. TaxID=2795000 RepID=UPI002A18E629|nr:hypothetical protein [Maridesulfovibrio sp.]